MSFWISLSNFRDIPRETSSQQPISGRREGKSSSFSDERWLKYNIPIIYRLWFQPFWVELSPLQMGKWSHFLLRLCFLKWVASTPKQMFRFDHVKFCCISNKIDDLLWFFGLTINGVDLTGQVWSWNGALVRESLIPNMVWTLGLLGYPAGS